MFFLCCTNLVLLSCVISYVLVFAWFYVWLFSPFPYSSSRSSTPPLVDSQRDGVSYGDVAWSAYGQLGRSAVDLCIVISQIGFCSAYLIFIIENLNPYYSTMTKGNWLVVLLPICFMMTLIPDLKKLAVISLLAQGINILSFLCVLEFDFEHYDRADLLKRNEFHGNWFFFISMAVYCFEVIYILQNREIACVLFRKFVSVFNATSLFHKVIF